MTNRKPPNAGKGRPKGARNKVTTAVKEAILAAANAQPGGVSGYLERQAVENPTAFMTLLGRILPLEHANADDTPFVVSISRADADL